MEEAKAIYKKSSRAEQRGVAKLTWNPRENSMHRNRSRGVRMLTTGEVGKSPEWYE